MNTKIILKIAMIVSCFFVVSCANETPTEPETKQHLLTVIYKTQVEVFVEGVPLGISPPTIAGTCGEVSGVTIISFFGVSKGCHNVSARMLTTVDNCAQKTLCNFSGNNMYVDISEICCQ